jgi:hypothetical protein
LDHTYSGLQTLGSETPVDVELDKKFFEKDLSLLQEVEPTIDIANEMQLRLDRYRGVTLSMNSPQDLQSYQKAIRDENIQLKFNEGFTQFPLISKGTKLLFKIY